MDFESILPGSRRHKEHEHYAELCALSTSGSLTEDELSELSAHLRHCQSCTKLLQSYRAVAKSAVSLLAPGVEAEARPLQSSWSVENAKKRLLNRIEADKAVHQPRLVLQPAVSRGNPFRMFTPLTAAAVLLLAAILSAFTYHLGQVRGRQAAQQVAASTTTGKAVADQLGYLTQLRTALEEQLAARGREVERLKQELQLQATAITEFKSSQDKLQRDTKEQTAIIAGLGSETNSLATERDATLRKLQEAQDALAVTQHRLDALQAEHDRQLLQTASLQTRVNELSATLKESEETVRRAEKFLVSDRDIRDLMGARDLYIADVFDIDREGKTRKAFGRVFYTAGKSLIFYAFDLDRQPGVREASFQAWGRRGPGDKRPLNMGILYLDNAANRRWALRFDDPKVLNEIDAMFVTVEPRGGGQKPSGKQLLFASLRTPPNHP